MKVSWAVETISINIALFVTLLYWSAVHGYVLQYKLLEDEADWMFNIFNHSFNTLLSILDLIISARPVSLYHAYLPVMYGLLYSLSKPHIFWRDPRFYFFSNNAAIFFGSTGASGATAIVSILIFTGAKI